MLGLMIWLDSRVSIEVHSIGTTLEPDIAEAFLAWDSLNQAPCWTLGKSHKFSCYFPPKEGYLHSVPSRVRGQSDGSNTELPSPPFPTWPFLFSVLNLTLCPQLLGRYLHARIVTQSDVYAGQRLWSILFSFPQKEQVDFNWSQRISKAIWKFDLSKTCHKEAS